MIQILRYGQWRYLLISGGGGSVIGSLIERSEVGILHKIFNINIHDFEQFLDRQIKSMMSLV